MISGFIVHANDKRDLVEKVSRLNPQVVILDIGLLFVDGWSSISELRKRNKQLKIIFTSCGGTSSSEFPIIDKFSDNFIDEFVSAVKHATE